MLKLKDEELLYILEMQLPEMLERSPNLEPRAFRSLIKVFTTKEETAAILTEMREFHGEFRHFQIRVEDRFDQIDRRSEQVDARFDQVDARFDQVDTRFDQVDEHLQQVDGHLQQVDEHLQQVDEHLQQVDGHLQQVDGHLQQVDGHLQQVDGHLEGVDEHLEGVDARFDQIDRTIADLRDWVEVNVGGLQRRSGRKLEDVVAGALRVALERPDIRPDQLRLRQRMVDETGIVGLPGQKRPFEVDILAQDGQITVFEVKSYCEWEDIDRLADKVKFIGQANPGVKVEGIMIAMSIGDDVRERCTELGITLVYHGD